MMGRVWIVFQVECQKALYQRLTWVAPLFIVLVAASAPSLHPIHKDGISDYGFVLFCATLLNGNLLLLFSLIHAASLIAPDISSGLARHVFVRPISRTDWLLGKLSFALFYTSLMSLLCSVLAWGIALGLGELAGVHFGGELVYTEQEIGGRYWEGAFWVLPPLWAGVAFAVFLSCVSRSSLSAAGLALALVLVLDAAKYPLGIENWVFTTWLEGAWQGFGGMANGLSSARQGAAFYSVGSSLLVLVPSLTLSIFVLSRRNLVK